MPKSIVDLVGELAEKAGISKDDEKLKSFMTNSSLASVTIDDGIVAAMNQKLIPLEAAKNHPELSQHFKATYYNGVDTRLDKVLDELDLDETEKLQVKNALSTEKSTPEKAALLVKQISALKTAKANAGLKGDKKEFQDKIDQLQAQLADITTKSKADLSAKDKEIADLHLQYLLDGELSGYNYAFPEGVPQRVKLSTVKGVLTDELRKAGATLVNDNGVLVLKNADGSTFYTKDHKPQNFKEFTDGALAQNKLLATTKSTGKDAGKQGGNGQIITGSDNPVNNADYKSKLAERLAEIEAGAQN